MPKILSYNYELEADFMRDRVVRRGYNRVIWRKTLTVLYSSQEVEQVEKKGDCEDRKTVLLIRKRTEVLRTIYPGGTHLTWFGNLTDNFDGGLGTKSFIFLHKYTDVGLILTCLYV